MKIEHIAYNVADPVAVAAWYGQHLGLKIVRHLPAANQTHFLADDQATVLEIYCNPPEAVPDYAALHPLQLHLAVASSDAPADAERLIAAGASLFTDLTTPDGSRLIMLRDPWGLALQVCQRAAPLLG